MRKPDDIRRLVAAQLDQPLDSLPDALPIREAVVDSFALVELVIRLQEETGLQINGDDMRRVESVGDLISVFVDDQHSCRDSAGT
ncbi:MAG: acyl carrier protein [Chromatiales bacterium]|nr:acyl carrier protein [Chromatiales bacterium]MDH4030420.1 acyl carrier protein [Chromatiales bacterium]